MTQVELEKRWTPRRPSIGWASLTDSERRLAALVSEGMTNRQVAEQLFISRHTVDTHLRHIFAKLGINSRVGLARLVAVHTYASEASL
jgi:DNA-binding CsgD family transcriptional regulator